MYTVQYDQVARRFDLVYDTTCIASFYHREERPSAPFVGQLSKMAAHKAAWRYLAELCGWI
jgi:hypothetical protein